MNLLFRTSKTSIKNGSKKSYKSSLLRKEYIYIKFLVKQNGTTADESL